MDRLRVEGTRQMTITSFEPSPVAFHFSADAFQLLLMVLTGWLARREREVVDYLIEENRCLRRQLGGPARARDVPRTVDCQAENASS